MTEAQLRAYMNQFPPDSIGYKFLQQMLRQVTGAYAISPLEQAQRQPSWPQVSQVLQLQNFIDNHSWDPTFDKQHYQGLLDSAKRDLLNTPGGMAAYDQIVSPLKSSSSFLLQNGIDPSSIPNTVGAINEANRLAQQDGQAQERTRIAALNQPSNGHYANPAQGTSASSGLTPDQMSQRDQLMSAAGDALKQGQPEAAATYIAAVQAMPDTAGSPDLLNQRSQLLGAAQNALRQGQPEAAATYVASVQNINTRLASSPATTQTPTGVASSAQAPAALTQPEQMVYNYVTSSASKSSPFYDALLRNLSGNGSSVLSEGAGNQDIYAYILNHPDKAQAFSDFYSLKAPDSTLATTPK